MVPFPASCLLLASPLLAFLSLRALPDNSVVGLLLQSVLQDVQEKAVTFDAVVPVASLIQFAATHVIRCQMPVQQHQQPQQPLQQQVHQQLLLLQQQQLQPHPTASPQDNSALASLKEAREAVALELLAPPMWLMLDTTVPEFTFNVLQLVELHESHPHFMLLLLSNFFNIIKSLLLVVLWSMVL